MLIVRELITRSCSCSRFNPYVSEETVRLYSLERDALVAQDDNRVVLLGSIDVNLRSVKLDAADDLFDIVSTCSNPCST
jgi:hypothetical protein